MKAKGLDHEGMEALIAAHVLDGLDEEERNGLLCELARHGAGCDECSRLVREYSEVAGSIAMTVDPVALSPGAEDRLLQAAREEQIVPLTSETANRGGRRWAVWIAVAAAMAVIGGVIGYSASPNGASTQARFLSFISRPGSRVVAFPVKGRQQLAVVLRQGEPGGWVIGSNFPEPPRDRVYELWFRPEGGARMEPAGTFSPDNGTVLASARLHPDVIALAVSVEPRGGSPQPTSEPILLTSVTAA